MSTSRRDVTVLSVLIEQASPSRTARGIMTDSITAHPAVASALGFIPLSSRTQTLGKSGSLIHCKMYTHTIKAPLHPVVHP